MGEFEGDEVVAATDEATAESDSEVVASEEDAVAELADESAPVAEPMDARLPEPVVDADAQTEASEAPPAEVAEAAETPDDDLPDLPVSQDAATGDAEAAGDEAPPSDEDIAAAVAASSEQVGVEQTLDDIAPGTAQPLAEEAPVDAATRYGVPWWPFLAYLGFWVAFAGIAVWQFQQLPASAVVYEAAPYTMFVAAGLALAVAGVILIFAVWFGARASASHHRSGLFTSALIKGAGAILVGVVIWWGTIIVLEYLRLGRFI